MEKPFARLLLWDDPVARGGAGHMARDEALLADAGDPILRTYRWDGPAVTFGYSQRLEAVRPLAAGRPVMRRWTGGGTVFHGEDLTLALSIPAGSALALQKSDQIYRAIHEALLTAIGRTCPAARLVTREECRCGPVCFESPAAHDVVDGFVKILGGAMRRSREGILYQGSLRSRGPAPRDLAEALSDNVEIFSRTSALERAAGILERERYATEAWRNLR